MLSRFQRYLGLALAALLGLGACAGSDTTKAQIRLLNASADYASLDLYADDDRKIEGVAYENASGYAKLGADTYTVKLKKNGVSSTLQTLSGEKLSEDSHKTYVAYGSTGHFATLKIDEDQGKPDSNKSKVLVINTADAGDLDVYLTDDTVDLADASPVFSSITNGSAASAGYQTIDSGSYRLRVTAAGDKTDLRFDRSGVAFDSKQVVSLVLSATQGGVLVNVLWLPQQGSLTKFANTKARVRGAVGISQGTAVTASVAGVNVLTSATTGIISSTYKQIDAGTAAVTLSVDGNPVTVAGQTLTAGGDYTLLVWDSSGTTQTTLVSDDNRLPSDSAKAKIRLLNGMSGFGGAVTLSVDYSPVAESVSLGQASSYTETANGTDYVLDVTNASTSANLLSRSSVSLQAKGVYTMFVSGGGSSTVNGILRKDR